MKDGGEEVKEINNATCLREIRNEDEKKDGLGTERNSRWGMSVK